MPKAPTDIGTPAANDNQPDEIIDAATQYGLPANRALNDPAFAHLSARTRSRLRADILALAGILAEAG